MSKSTRPDHRIPPPDRFRWIFLVPLVAGLFACSHEPRVVITTRDGREVAFRVEVADTRSKRELGLQYRQELREDRGMLFLFPAEGPRSFWMKNTPISLDIIFIDSRRRIVGIVHEAVPFSTDLLSVSAPSRYVLEVPGGLARRKRVGVGDSVLFEGISLEKVPD